MKSITARQTEVLNFIKSFISDHSYPPTVREVASAFSISVKGAYDHIKALEKKSYITCDNKRSRAIEVCDPDDFQNPVKEEDIVNIPLLGNVAAGLPLSAEENNDGYIPYPGSQLPKGNHFALTVQGDSMVGAGILDGDTAIILQQPVAENGQIVVAVLNGAVTLKRFYREKERIRLEAENENYSSIYSSDLQILGKLVAVMRQYG